MNTQNPFEHIQDVHLSEDEKRIQLDHIQAYMKAHPLKPKPSPYIFFSHLREIAFICLAIVVLGTGVTFASSTSLPGDTLYSVRLAVYEPVEDALTFSSKGKAKLAVEKVNRRLKDLEHASLRKVATDTQARIAAEAVTSMDRAHVAITSLESNDTYELSTDFKATLSAHTTILEKVQKVSSSTEQTQTVLVYIENSLEAVATTSKIALENKNSKQPVQKDVERKKDEVTLSIQKIRDMKYSKEPGNSSSTPAITQKLDEVDSILKEGDEKLTTSDTSDEFELYNKADEKVSELKIIIQAQEDLGIHVLEEDHASTTEKNSEQASSSEKATIIKFKVDLQSK